jgi:hypothetical protein
MEDAPEAKTDLDKLVRGHSDSYQQWLSSRRCQIAGVIRLAPAGLSKLLKPSDKRHHFELAIPWRPCSQLTQIFPRCNRFSRLTFWLL